MTKGVAVAICVVHLACASSAFAQEPLADAEARYARADFEGALEALEDLLGGNDGLTRAQLASVYELRLLISVGVSDEGAIDGALAMLAIVSPEHRFRAEMPPEVVDRHRERVRSLTPLAIAVTDSIVGANVRLRASLEGDGQELVRARMVHARVDDGEWQGGDDELTVPSGAALAYYAEATGPGGALLASEGSRGAPRWLGAEPTSGGDEALFIGLGVGGGVLVVAAIVAVVLVVTLSGTQTVVDGPHVLPP